MAIHSQCHLIAVTGGKGGVGKSVLAANLALAIISEQRTPVLLVDADQRSSGDQNVITGLKPNKTLSELAQFSGVISPQGLGQVLAVHPSGLHYIGAVRSPDESLKVDTELAMKQLENLSKIFKFIIVDVGNDIGDLQTEMILESSACLLVAAPEILVINQTQKLMGELMARTVPMDLLQLVINKMNNGGISPSAISQALRLAPIALIPQDDATVLSSLQRSTPFLLQGGKSPLMMSYIEMVRKLTGGILQKNKSLARPKGARSLGSEVSGAGVDAQAVGGEKLDPFTLLKLKIHTELIKAMDLKKGITDTNGDPSKEAALKQKTLQTITVIVDKEAQGMARDERSRIIKEVLDEALGLGPLEDLLADPSVTEIMVNGAKRIFIERSGRIQLTPVTFTSNMHLRNVVERIVTPLGRRIDEKTPYVDARLKDGSRVNAVIEPLSIDGPAITIRKFKKGGITPEQYIQFGAMTKSMIDFLKICVENGLNVVISGGTGSGKTSLLNMLSSFIPASDRVVTIEDAAELQLLQEHVVRLETRPANMEGTGAVTIRDLIKNALRMRPDRIIVGETRDGAALDMLQAMNTGHDGSMTTTHANNPREGIARLETLCMMAGMELPAKAIRDQISSAVQLIIQASRLSDGSRKVTSITEVVGMQGDVVTLAEIFRFKETGFDKNRKIIGQFLATGHIPTFIEKLEQKGVIVPRGIFSNEQPAQPVKMAAGSGLAAGGGSSTPQGGAVKKPLGMPPPLKKS